MWTRGCTTGSKIRLSSCGLGRPRRGWHPQLVKRLEAVEPVTIPHWRIGGNSWPQARDWPVYRDRSVRAWEVHADDVVVPVHARDV